MMMKNKKLNIAGVLCCLGIIIVNSFNGWAQSEMILPLRNNAVIKSAKLNNLYSGNRITSINSDTLYLPFFDDFSTNSVWPSAERWTDSSAFINFNFPINPPTVGVATFDGLNQEGNPYNIINVNASGRADELTSRPINLFNDVNGLPYNTGDSLFLIFYYERKGRGDNPETSDSLALEFLDAAAQQWNTVWFAKGNTSGDTVFTKVKISINDPIYRQNGFRFRFHNYGSLSGLLDIWNVDYVSLNKFLQPDYENIRDFAFVYEGISLLNNYSAIPWKHFTFLSAAQQQAFVKPAAELTIRNNNEANPFPIKISGISYDQYGAPTTIVGGIGLNSIQVPLNSNVAPPATLNLNTFFQDPTTGDHATFNIIYELGQTSGASIDDYSQNDSLKYTQDFYNYYAYDDGSAELGYGVSGTGAQLAYKIQLIKPDTLRAVQMFFAQLGANVTNQIFKLAVWTGGAAGPVGAPVYQKFNQTPNYTDSINGFYTYNTDPLFLPAGTWYFGFIQTNATILNLGLDINTPADPSRKFINTNGAWTNSQLPGMWMIRPVFSGDPINVGINDVLPETALTIYPVPSGDIIHIKLSNPSSQSLNFKITDISGRIILKKNEVPAILNVSEFSPGIYFLHIYSDVSGTSLTRKIIVAGK